MIGNDIVDLQQSRLDSNWQRTGWLEKLFTKEEIKQIKHNDVSSEAEKLVWQMWSMKESAYKIWNRVTRKSCFSPTSFACRLYENQPHAGTVVFDRQQYATKTIIHDQFIHTIVTTENNLPSARVYISDRSADCNMPKNMVFYKDEYGMPFVLDKEMGKVSYSSKSHHGRFQAVVYF